MDKNTITHNVLGKGDESHYLFPSSVCRHAGLTENLELSSFLEMFVWGTANSQVLMQWAVKHHVWQDRDLQLLIGPAVLLWQLRLIEEVKQKKQSFKTSKKIFFIYSRLWNTNYFQQGVKPYFMGAQILNLSQHMLHKFLSK